VSGMINALYQFPESCLYNKPIPKARIFANSSANTRIQNLFSREVSSIIWKYKLSPETIQLKPSQETRELQIIEIHLKGESYHPDILETLDRAIPSAVVFEIVRGNERCLTATYKRRSEADSSKHVLYSYLRSPWIQDDYKRENLPVVLGIHDLYMAILNSLSPIGKCEHEDMDGFFTRMNKITTMKKEIERLESRLHKERQFNRKVDLNKQIKVLKGHLEVLSQC
jgi:hypothetical protein